jgi:hypothetical protein
MSAAKHPEIVLGWEVTKGLDPRYWLTPNATPGHHHPDDLVSVLAKNVAHHIVVVAQSGSGKSFFLGRLVEEILLKTQCRILILDPNSDFRRVAATVNAERWKTARYNATERSGFLPDEPTAESFSKKWNKVSKAVWSAREDPTGNKTALRIDKLEIDWTGISTDVLLGELDPVLESEVRRCHDFVRTISRLISYTKPDNWTNQNDLMDVAQGLCDRTRDKHQADVVDTLKREFPFNHENKENNKGLPAPVVSTAVNLLYLQAGHSQEICIGANGKILLQQSL